MTFYYVFFEDVSTSDVHMITDDDNNLCHFLNFVKSKPFILFRFLFVMERLYVLRHLFIMQMYV